MRMIRWSWVAALVLAAAAVYAADTVNQGMPGSYGPWFVTLQSPLPDGGTSSGLVADQGAHGAQPWPVSLPQVADGGTLPVSGTVELVGMTDGGTLPVSGTVAVTPRMCSSPSHAPATLVGTTAVACPSSQLTGRTFIQLCNSLRNTPGALVTVRLDGVAPTTDPADPGIVLGVGDCLPVSVTDSVVPLCIADSSNTIITTVECL